MAGQVQRLPPTPAVDGLRGIAVLLVVVAHTNGLTAPGFPVSGR